MSTTTATKDADIALSLVNEALRKLDELKRERDGIEAKIQDSILALYNRHEERIVDIDKLAGDLESDIIEVAKEHPEWFVKPKTKKFLYGTVQARDASSLKVRNEENTLELIRSRMEEPARFIRTKEEPNLEALEDLGDDELRKLGIKREQDTNYTVKAKTVTLDELAKQKQQATKAQAKAKAKKTTKKPKAT